MESKYRLGVVSVSFRDRTPEEVLKAAKGAGLDCVEWGSDVHAPCRDYERLCEISGLQEKYGLICSSYGTYFRLGQTPIEELTDYIRAARILGTDILRLWCGAKSGADTTQKEREELLEQRRRAERERYYQELDRQRVSSSTQRFDAVEPQPRRQSRDNDRYR